MKVNAALIKLIFDYRPSDGGLIWRVNTGKKQLIGMTAGVARRDGYRRVGVLDRDYYIHHLVWAWHHGEWPSRIDHANGDPSDNRIENLRLSTQSQNLANSKARKRECPKGVTRVRDASTFTARLTVNYQQINLGNFSTEEEAHAAYMGAAVRYFGDFARSA